MLAPAARRRSASAAGAPASPARAPPRPERPATGLTPAYLPATDLATRSSLVGYSSELSDDALACTLDDSPAVSSDGTRPDPMRTARVPGAPPPRAVTPPRPGAPPQPGHGVKTLDTRSLAGETLTSATLHAGLAPEAPRGRARAEAAAGHGGGAAAAADDGLTQAALAPSEVAPIPEPTQGSHWLTREPISVALHADPFSAARGLDIEPARPPKTEGKQADPATVQDYRGLYAGATGAAFGLYRRLTEEAAQIVERWRDRDRSLADLHQSRLDLALSTLAGGLGQARARLAGGRDAMLEKLAGEADAMRARIRGAASGALGALAARHAVYEKSLAAPRSRRAAIEHEAASGQAEIARQVIDASMALDEFGMNVEGHITQAAAAGDATDAAIAPAVREAKIEYVPSRIARAQTSLDQQGDSVDGFLTQSFACLPCEFDRAFQALDARVHNVSVLGPQAVLSARAGGLRAIDDTAGQLRKAIEDNHAGTDAALVQQHDRMREVLIRNAEGNATRERAGIADAAERQSDMLGIMAGAQSAAVAQVREWLLTQAGQTPAVFADTVSRAALRLRANLEGIGEKQPRMTSEARDRLDARTQLGAEAFESHQDEFTARTSGSLGDLADQSIRQIGQRIAETLGSLDHVPRDVRASCNGYLEPMGAAYDGAVNALAAAIEATGGHVRSVFSGAEAAGGSTAMSLADGSDEPNMCSADDVASYAPQTPAAAAAPPAPAAAAGGTPAPGPASCGSCGGAAPEAGAEGDGAGTSTAPGADGAGTAADAGAGGGARNTPQAFGEKCDGIADDPTTAPEVASFLGEVPEKVGRVLSEKMKAINASLAHIFSPNTDQLMGALRGLTAAQGTAIRALYRQDHSRALDQAIHDGYLNAMSWPSTIEANTNAAIDALNGNATGAAMSELVAAFNFSNEDQRIRDILLALTPLQLAELKAQHGAELTALAAQLDGEDLRIYNDLLAGNTAYADASTLRHDIDTTNNDKEGEERGDAIAARIDAASHESHALGGDPARYSADLFGLEDPDAVRDRNARHWEQVQVAFGTLPGVIDATGGDGATASSTMPGSALFAYATRPITHEVQSYGDEGGAGPPITYDDNLDPYHRAWIEQVLRHGGNSDEARGAHVLVERRRASGDPKLPGLDDALHVEESDIETRADGTRPTADERRGAIFLASEQLRYRLEGGNPPPATAAEAQDAVAGDLAHSFSGDANARAIAQGIVGSNQGNPRAVIDYAIDHENTELALKYVGRMDRDQVDTLVAGYNADHPNGPSLYARLGLFDSHWSLDNMNGAVFSGDKANELEIAFMGRPRNARERAEVALRVMDQQVEQSGGLGRLLAGEEYDALTRNADRLRGLMGAGHGDVDALGRIRITDPATGLRVHLGNFDESGNFVAPHGATGTQFETAIGMAHTVAEGYTAATDRIASYITTALMVVAAVVTTALTGGAAASIWIPVLVTAGAGLVGMGLTAAMKGGRYSRDEIVRDLAMTVVQAATAGIGAAAGAALRGGTAALKTLATGLRVSEEALTTAAGAGGLRALTAFEEIAIGAGLGALSGGVGAAVDPEARHGEHYGMGILHGILKGAIGGGAAAGATRVVAGGINNLARGMGARSGARAALEAGASEEAALRMAALRSRAYGTSFFTEAGSRALGAGVGGVASRGTEIAYDWGVRKQRLSGGQIAEELGGAFFQNAAQGFLEASADRGMRAASPAREAEHVWTTRHDQHDYDERARRAVDGEMERIGMPGPDPLPAPGPGSHPPPPPPPPSAAAHEAGPPPPPPSGGHEAAVPGSGANAKSPAAAEPEPLALPRSAIDEERGGGRVVEAANDNGPPGAAPARTRMALEHADMVTMGRIAEGTVYMHPESKSPIAANDNFGRMILADPTREVAVYHNPVTGEYIVIQGERASVGAITPEGKLVWGARGENSSYAWQSLLNSRDGHWVLRTHYHPNAPGEHGAPLLLRLPSGRGGDFGVIEREVTMLGHESRSSRIYYNDAGHVGYTDFGYEPGRKGGPLWVDFADPANGARITRSFADFNEYHAFVGAVRRDPEAAMASARSGPMPRSAEDVEPPRALAPGARETALTPADRATIADFHERMQIVSDHQGVLRTLTAAGASESTVAAARGWLADAQGDARTMAHAMGLVGEPDSAARLHLLLNDRGLTVAARAAMADTVLEATRAHLIAAGRLDPGEPLVMLYHGAPEERARSLKNRGVRFDALDRGTTDDFGRGLYLTRDLETAALYTRSRGGAMGLRPDETPGEIFPFILRGRDMGTVVDVGPGGAHRDQWEAFARAHYFEYEHLPNPEVDMAMIRGEEVPFGRLDGFGPRGELFDRFLATLEPPFDTPSMVSGELGGPFTSGIGHGHQQAARGESVLNMLDEQMGFRRAADDLAIPRANEAEPAAGPVPAEPDEVDLSFAATFGIPAISEKPVLTRESFTDAERAAGARQALEMQAAIAGAVRGFEGGADPDAAALRGLRNLAPAEMAAILLGGGDGAPGLRRGVDGGAGIKLDGALTPRQRETMRAALAAHGLDTAAIDAHLADLARLLRPDGALRQAMAHAAERAAWSRAADALTPRLTEAMGRYLDENGIDAFAGIKRAGSAGPDMKALLAIDRAAAIAAVRGGGPAEDRIAAYQRRRKNWGAPAADIVIESERLARVLADPDLPAAMQATRQKYEATGATSAALATMARQSPEMLVIARTHPDYLLERYFSAMEDAGAKAAGKRTLGAAEFASKVANNQDGIIKPIVSEGFAAEQLVRSMNLRLLKADALSRGLANKGGIDIVGIVPRLANEPPESRPRVLLADDKALAGDMLNDVSAMTGAKLGGNLRKAAAEIEERFEYNRRCGIEPDADDLAAVAQMKTAADRLDAIHADRTIGIAKSGGRGKGRSIPRERTAAYAEAVARALADNNIAMMITGEIGNVSQMAPWLRSYGFLFQREYLDLLDKLNKALARRGAAGR